MAATEEKNEERQSDGKNVGRIEEITGVVIEAVFPDELPEINSAGAVDLGQLVGEHRLDHHAGDLLDAPDVLAVALALLVLLFGGSHWFLLSSATRRRRRLP